MHRWLTLLVIAFITAVVFIFFFLRLQPVWTPNENTTEKTSTVTTTNVPTVTFVDPKKGTEKPTVTIVVFSDFQCQPCKDLSESLDVIIRTEPKVQVVWKDFPNESLHDMAVSAAVAARCGAAQGKFWEFHDEIFSQQFVLGETVLNQIAKNLGLDEKKYQTCFNNQETLPLVRKDFEEGQALQISATPTFFINNERYAGSYTAEEILELVNRQLQVVENK